MKLSKLVKVLAAISLMAGFGASAIAGECVEFQISKLDHIRLSDGPGAGGGYDK